MAGERRYTRIPPESTGDRVHVRHSMDIPYSGRLLPFFNGQEISFQTTGITGIVSRVRQDTGTTGVISVTFDDTALDNNLTPSANENIINDVGTVATVASNPTFVDIYTNTTTVVGYDRTYNGLLVDSQGAAAIRFAEGAATLDAFGKLRVSSPTVLGEYSFPHGIDTINWTTTQTGGGSVTHSTNGKNALLTTSASSGDTAELTTDLYHKYVSGISQNIVMTVALGDTGKSNLVREWGYFDDANGAFFRLDGSTLQVVIRESTSGTANEITLNQSNWNGDQINGQGGANNKSGKVIDLTNINIYWIDIQWLGGGRIRFGTYVDGQRVTIHEHYHANLFPRANMQRGSLPVRLRQENNGAVGSTSEMKFWCASVVSDTEINITSLGRAFSLEIDGTTSGGTETFVGGIRPIATLADGEINHNLYFPQNVNVGAFDTTAGTPGTILIRVYQGGTITGGTWINKVGTEVETNTTGSIGSPGLLLAKYFVTGTFRGDLIEVYNSTIAAIKNKYDGTQQGFYITAQRMYGANDIDVYVSYGMKGIQI